MIKLAFLLGRPGTGKSTLAQLIEASAPRRGWSTQHFYDYKYLQDMFLQETKKNIPLSKRNFRQKGPEACHGFDVLRFEVLDTALEQMADDIRTARNEHPTANKLFLIEFARKEYCRALHIFSYEILNGAHLLYIKLDLENCIKRVQERSDVHRLRSEYDHFVSEEIMRGYYGRDDWSGQQLSEYLNYLCSDGVDVKTEELDNSGTDLELEGKVKNLFSDLVAHRLVAVS